MESFGIGLTPNIGLIDRRSLIVPLARQLKQGSMGLFLGAGVSLELGLPNWTELAWRCSGEAGVPFSNDMSLRQFGDELELKVSGKLGIGESVEYRRLIHKCLYREFDAEKIWKSELLHALGALTMGSRRGSIKEVFTLNYDDLLERYLKIYGYTNQVVSRLGGLFVDSDVTTFHPHGFLPKFREETEWSDFLVFSEHSYDAKFGSRIDGWGEEVKRFLNRKCVLFLGLSTEDPTWGKYIYGASELSDGSGRMLGCWFFKDPTESQIKWCTRKGIVPVGFSDYKEFPKFILEICETAAGLA